MSQAAPSLRLRAIIDRFPIPPARRRSPRQNQTFLTLFGLLPILIVFTTKYCTLIPPSCAFDQSCHQSSNHIMEDGWNSAQHIMKSQLQSSGSTALVGPATTQFLDTIPEDKSVVAARIANLSTASAVASSDSDSPAPKSPRSSDGVSETPALLEGGGELPGGAGTEQAPSGQRGRSNSTTCTRRTYLFYITMTFVFIAIAVGVYFIIQSVNEATKNSSHDDNESLSPEQSGVFPPTPDPFPPFYFSIESESPTASPSFNLDDRNDIDEALLKISSSSSIYDPEQSQGKCRYWLTHVDGLQLRANKVGEERIQQRYILCVLYYETNGKSWNKQGFLQHTSHECNWVGVSCDYDSKVAVLSLENTNLVGSLPDEITYLAELQFLSIFGNGLGGSIPQDLFSSLTKLFWCDMSENQLTGTVPLSSTSKALEDLYLYNNTLRGDFPWFPNLQRLWIKHNFFIGIDERYATMSTLKELVVNDNDITGNIPDEWDAPNLAYLNLSKNPWVSGPIPESLWKLPALESLVLNDCQLTGSLPVTGERNSFQHISLHSNSLSGPIPPTLGSEWQNLNSLLLYDNLLTGTIDKDQCSRWPDLEQLETDCDLDILRCDCCTLCHGID